jgi:hypothetical protein
MLPSFRGRPEMFGKKFIKLIAVLIITATAVGAPIDAKNEHLGLRLGTLRSELKLKADDYGSVDPYTFQFVRPPEGMQTPNLHVFVIRVPTGATFGDYPISTVVGYYLSDRLCRLSFGFELPRFSGDDVKDNESRHALDAVAEALRQKYGDPTEIPTLQGDERDYKLLAKWTGDDIVLSFANSGRGSISGDYVDGVIGARAVTLESKSAFKAAEEEAVRRFREQERRRDQRAKAARDDL